MIADAFFARMVGLPKGTANLSGRDRKKRKPGIFGHADAWHYCVECQGKGTLHFHALIWGGLSPELLSAATDNAKLRAEHPCQK